MAGRRKILKPSFAFGLKCALRLSFFAFLFSSILFAENQMSLGFSCTGQDLLCDNNAEGMPPTKPGRLKTFSVEVTKATGSADTGRGTTELLPSGFMKFGIDGVTATGRLVNSVTYNRNNREGLSLDSFLIFRSFFSDTYFNVLSSTSSCQDTPASAKTYNWVFFRGRSSQSLNDKMYANDSAIKFAGVVKADSATGSVLDGTGSIDLNTLSLDTTSYPYSLYNGATCSTNSQKLTADESVQPLGALGTLYWGDNNFVMVSRGTNPTVALGIPQVTLSSGWMQALYGNNFSGMLYYQSTIRQAVFKTLLISPDSSGMTFDLGALSDFSNTSSSTSWGSVTCDELNAPAPGFCKATLTKSGQTGKAICAFGNVNNQGIMACSAQLPSDKSIPIYFFGAYPARSSLLVSAPTLEGKANTQTCGDIVVTNNSGKVATDFSVGTLPAGVSLGTGAYDGLSGRCGTKVEAFQSCTVPVCVTLSDTATRTIASAYKENVDSTDSVTATLAFNKAPVPVISVDADVTSGLNPLTVNFSGIATAGSIETWVYDYGDSSSGTTSAPQFNHSFTSGSYTVSIYGLDAYGQQSNTVNFTIDSLLGNGVACGANSECNSGVCSNNYCDGGNLAECTNYAWLNGHYYCFMNSGMIFSQARYSAPTLSQFPLGGYLVTVTSEEERNLVWNMISPYTYDAWMGLNDVASEGTWQWVTGEQFSYSAWGGGQPDNCTGCGDPSGENFGHFWSGSPSYWNDIAGMGSMAAVYEYGEFSDLTPNPNCGYDYDGDGVCSDVDWNDSNSRANIPPNITSITYDDSIDRLIITGTGLLAADIMYVYETNWWSFGNYCSSSDTEVTCDFYLPAGTWDLGYYNSGWGWMGNFGQVTSNNPSPQIESTSYDDNAGVLTLNGSTLENFLYLYIYDSNWSGVWGGYYWDCGASISSNQITCNIKLSPGHYYAYFYDNWWTGPFFEFDIVENITGTVLLLKMDGSANSNSFVDSSPRNYPITTMGSPIQTTSTVRLGSASGYFDGSEGALKAEGSSNFSFGTKDFTVEMWIYPLSYGGSVAGGQLFGTTNGSMTGWSLNLGESVDRLRLISNMTGTWQDDLVVGAGGGPALSQWTHIALTRSGDTVRIFKNGTIVAQGTGYSNLSFSGGDAIIGRFNDGGNIRDFEGYMDEIKVVRGTALYTANFTPPQLPVNSNTVLLMHMEGTDGSTQFTDSSDYKFTVTPSGSAQISTAKSKVGTSSGKFNGSSQLKINYDSAFKFGTGDFTVEGWVNLSTIPNDVFMISGGQTGGFFLGYHSKTNLGFGRRGVAWDYEVNVALKKNEWHHIAVSRYGTTMRLFFDGLLVGTQENGNDYDLSMGGTHIGSHGDCYYLTGYIDEVRVTRGKALYTASFAPPTTPYVSQDEFTGNGVFDEFCYQNFVNLGAVGSGTGYCSGDQTFYIGGVPYPGLDANGTGASGNYYFVNAVPANGYINNVCYDTGVNTFGVVGGTGWCTGDSTYYLGGVATNLDSSGEGTYQGKYYVGGNVANQVVSDGTVLLLHMDGSNGSTSFTDASGLSHSPSSNGPTISTAQSKFGGSSAYFSGASNQYLSIPSHTDFGLGQGDFTVEFWARPTAIDSFDTVLEMNTYQTGILFRPGWNQDNLYLAYSWQNWSPSTNLPLNQWTHVALVRAAGVVNVYVNGSSVLSWNRDVDLGTAASVMIGASAHATYQTFTGYLDEFRIAKGKALYKSNFTPPSNAGTVQATCYVNGYATNDLNSSGTGTCSADGKYYVGGSKASGTYNGVFYVDGTPANKVVSDNTVLLLHMDGTNNSTSFTDSSANPKSVSVAGDAKVSTAQSKFGGASLVVDGSGDYLQTPANEDLAFGTADFTVEMNVRFASLGSSHNGLANTQNSLWWCDSAKWYFSYHPSYGLMFGRHATSNFAYAAWTPSLNTWYHVAASRKDGIMYLAIDGVNKTVTNSGIHNGVNFNQGTFTVGAIASPFYTNGYIDEVRVTKGKALYTTNFTVSSSAYGPGLTCYLNGVATSDLNSSGTGTCSGNGKYYVNGSAFNGTYNSLLYTNGVPANGLVFSGVELLMHMDGTHNSTVFTDSSGNQKTMTGTGDSVLSTSVKKFGSGSAYISESSIDSDEIVSIASGQDFTIEMWLYDFDPWVNWDGRQPAAIGIGPFIIWLHDNIRGTFVHDGSAYILQGWGVTPPPANQWSHVALTRSSNTLRLFIDGTLRESVNYSSAISGKVKIGGVYGPTGTNYNGYADEVRIVKGTAKYTSNFTPPTAAFVDGTCYVNGVATNTINSSGNGTCNGVTYVNGIPQ